MHPFSTAGSRSVPRFRNTPAEDKDPLAAFFGSYLPFKYNRHASSHDEYRRLCAFFGWPTRKRQNEHTERDAAWDGFRIAMVKAFNTTFGKDENDIEAWGRMCVLVGVEPIPATLEARREVRKATVSIPSDIRSTFLFFFDHNKAPSGQGAHHRSSYIWGKAKVLTEIKQGYDSDPRESMRSPGHHQTT